MSATEQIGTGRRSTDSEMAALAEWRKGVDTMLGLIHSQTLKTNGRVSELEVKERIRQDREEQKAIRDAAAEATKYRIEQAERDEAERAAEAARAEREHGEFEREHREQKQFARTTWRVMLLAAVLGALASGIVVLIAQALTGHLL